MKVIKRDGRAVDYDRTKIKIAIEKANNEVTVANRASETDIKGIITYIEELNKKRILVEDIQDIIEEKLMELKKYELAKKYIVYRYTRALVRKQNTTDETILGIIRNNGNSETKENITLSSQSKFISGEVSRDLTKRLLLPEKIVKAEEEGILYFHNADYFVHPMIGNSYINIEDMLEEGTVINGVKIENPSTFLVACLITTQIIAGLSTNQYGGQTVNIKYLGKYLRKSYEKIKLEIEEEYKEKLTKEDIQNLIEKRVKIELKEGIQLIQYQFNVLETINGKKPLITFVLQLEETDEYIKENALIIEEILKQRYHGIKDKEQNKLIPEIPQLIYVLDESNVPPQGKYGYITNLAIKCSLKCGQPSYLSIKNLYKNYKGQAFSYTGDTEFIIPTDGAKSIFNQGVVSINLAQIAILAEGDENKFSKLLNERLELCFEALMCRHYALTGTKSNVSPLHWQYGAISRLPKNDVIDDLLQLKYSTLTLGIVGICEMVMLMKNTTLSSEDGEKLALNVIKHIKTEIKKWSEETKINFVLNVTYSENILSKFAKVDKEKFGTIKGITDKSQYTSAYCINKQEKMDMFTKIKKEYNFYSKTLGGETSTITIEKEMEEYELEKCIQYVYDNSICAKLVKTYV